MFNQTGFGFSGLRLTHLFESDELLEILRASNPFVAVQHSIFHKRVIDEFGPYSKYQDRIFFHNEYRGLKDESNYTDKCFAVPFLIRTFEVVARPQVLANSDYRLIIGHRILESMAGRLSPMALDLVPRIVPPLCWFGVEAKSNDLCREAEIEVRLHGLLLQPVS